MEERREREREMKREREEMRNRERERGKARERERGSERKRDKREGGRPSMAVAMYMGANEVDVDTMLTPTLI